VRTENKKNGIRVSIFYPGRIKTNISLHALEKDGKEHGKMDQGQEKGIPAEKCARIIVKTVKRNRRDAVIARGEAFMVWLKKYIPSLFYSIASKISPT
jgi:short-subunit dehydrogenase